MTEAGAEALEELEQLYRDMQEIQQKRRKTIVFVTHNVREAVCLGDRVLVFSPAPGSIRDEFRIALPRPREINDVEVARHAAEVHAALRRHLPASEARA